MRGRASPLAALVALLAGACFAEAPTAGTTGQTTGEPCSTGAQGCSCYANGTCDAELECEPSLSLCVPQGCTPGALSCVCMEGTCAHPWVCEGGICRDEGEDTTSASATTATGSTSDPSTSSPGTTGDTTTGDSNTDTHSTGSATETGETSSSQCETRPSCSDCLNCVAQPGEPCRDEYVDCQSNTGCPSAVSCQASCAFYFDCSDDGCCSGLTRSAGEAADALTACRRQFCDLACPGNNADYPMCSE